MVLSRVFASFALSVTAYDVTTAQVVASVSDFAVSATDFVGSETDFQLRVKNKAQNVFTESCRFTQKENYYDKSRVKTTTRS